MSNRAGASGSTFWGDVDEAEALQRYRTLVNAIDDGIYRLDRDGRFVAVNDVVAETTGYAREELLGEHVSLVLDPDDVSAVEREIERRLSGADERRETFEFAVRTADGDRVPCELRLNPLVEDGEFRGTVGVVRDVSDRERTEQASTESERRSERESELPDRILETSPVGIVVLDGDGRVERMNDRAGELLGVPESERETYSPADRPVYDDGGRPVPPDEHPFARALETGEPVYGRVLQVERPDGERRWLSINAEPISNVDGEVERVVTTGEDVTAIKERERELEDELSEVFGRVTDAFYALDDEWRITYVNDRAEDLIDYRGEGLVGRDFWEVFEWATDSKLGEEYRTAMEIQEPTSFEFYYPEPLDSWYEVHAYPSETGLSVYFRDITDRKERERALEESERRYRTLVEHFPNGAVALVDEDLRYRTVGGNPLDVADVTAEEVEGRSVREVLPPTLADELVPHYEAALDGESGSFEAESNGRVYRFQVVPIRDEDGEVFAALGMSQDVTERRENQRKLAESERRYRTLVEHFPNGAVGLFDEDLRYTVAGGEAFDDVDASADAVVGKTLWERYPDELAAELEPKFRAALDGETNSFEWEFHDRHWLAHTVPISDDDGDIFAGMIMVQDITERTEYERKLAESERRYRTLAEHFPNGIVTLFDHDFEYTLAAGRGFEDIPVEPADLEGRSFREVWGEDTADALEPAFEAALDGREESVELAYAGREWVVHAVPITDERGDVFAGMTMAQDITEQKERERYLRDAKSQLEAATEAGAIGTWEWHVPDDRFVAGASFARTFGVDPDAAREGVALERFTSAIHEDDRERVERKIETAVETCGEYEAEYRVRDADGDLRWVVARGHVECDGEGNPVTFPGAVSDITERKRAEQALRENEKQLRTLLRLLPVGVIVAEDDGRLVQKNDAAEEIWGGFAEADAVADYERYRGWWPESGDPVEPEEWPLARALRGEEITDPEVIEIERFDGGRRTVLFHSMPIRGPDGEVTRAVVTMTDITDREERQRLLQEQNERLESFASMLAHELRNPVTIGQIYSRRLPDESDSEAVEYVAEAFERIEDMIDIMLMMTRGQEAVDESRPVSLADAADDAWDEVDGPSRLRVETAAEIRGDETYLRHLFRNLFENSLQHGGTDVTVEVGDLDSGFYVADDGEGIPPEDRQAVFEAGFTTAKDAGGTGLGLAFVGELADAYDWECTVTDSESGGARFEFRNVEFVGDG